MHIVLLGTCDTKLDELLYLRSQILGNGDGSTRVTFVDVGRSLVEHEAITVTQNTLIEDYAPGDARDVSSLPRGEVVKYMISCASSWLRETYQAGLKDPSEALHAIISIGGTGGTSLASGVMRDILPIGFPKLIVSTAASGDTGPIVGESDITLMYSVVEPAVPEKFNARKLFGHNPTVTLMRTSPDECRKIGVFVVEKIMTHAADGKKVQVVLPKGGVSMIATPGGPFYDAEADGAIFTAVRDGLSGSGVVLREDDRDVNHEDFAIDVAEQMVALLGLQRD
ncbi:hypothetical protein TI39_contig4174g00002 [Zymoseptoria brevis]|uniref:Uncharacterized protein n=1 Tax=Zymoseptoria brevis TaxID=1047168 RepID=A0A0F4GB62_9PEZI|nr:hypothetical protein TI39_contig4174g00002 [Zymoseptoria brevis]